MTNILAKTLNNVNLSLTVMNALCDARNEERIPVKYYFDHKIEMFIIEPIEEKDCKRFYWIANLMLDYPNLKERARRNCKTIVTKNMKKIFYTWENK